MTAEYADNSSTRSVGAGLAVLGAVALTAGAFGGYQQAGEEDPNPGSR